MEKRVNERYEQEKSFKFDKVYVCDNCGKEQSRDFNIKISLPPHSMIWYAPGFCSAKCLKEFFNKPSERLEELEKDSRHYRGDPEDDREEKFECGLWQPLEFWKELFNGK